MFCSLSVQSRFYAGPHRCSTPVPRLSWQFSLTSAAAVSTQASMSGQQCYTTGAIINALAEQSINKKDELLIMFKRCLDQAAANVFNGHATVQLQGSVSKGAALQGLSDWDFYVRLTDAIPQVTQQQRMQFVREVSSCMQQSGISSGRLPQPGENRVKFTDMSAYGKRLPDADVVFARFKNDARYPPNPKALANSHEAQYVVKYFKRLTIMYTNLGTPKSMHLEGIVLSAEDDVISKVGYQGATSHFDAVMTAALGVVERGQMPELAKACMASEDWRRVAAKVLQLHHANSGWPW